jgi:hypothetical protein
MKMRPSEIIYFGDSKISSAERDVLLSEPACDRYKTNWIKPRMSRQRAEYVRQLRCAENRSYRVVACITSLEWGADANWEPLSNQLAGMALCRARRTTRRECGGLSMAGKRGMSGGKLYPWIDEEYGPVQRHWMWERTHSDPNSNRERERAEILQAERELDQGLAILPRNFRRYVSSTFPYV